MSNGRFPAVVDDVTVRLIAAVVLVFAVTALVGQQWWLYAVLGVDFVLRAALGPRVSPIAYFVSTLIRPYVAASPRPTPGAPKRFAAGIGAVLTITATALWVISLVTGWAGVLVAVAAIGVLMVIFPALEAVAGVCVGCQAFAGLMRLGVIPEEVCLECSDITRRQRLRSVS
ncbi:hypothetical protein BA895_02260 [Humibacillus sp. DSM 29435]|uniref:DUF4395 domain-containing protein n=1 Tax=Humibacillus sp. DSM 29435 TaxID=1869167 RepID=UPI000872AEFB|nr:DUF4395 domain-containing protein [Humibacillus sp. DSM 29435]OFE18996.1 hypothetical protein BA895_02260 [Humibacillus sp. DSM 29435]